MRMSIKELQHITLDSPFKYPKPQTYINQANMHLRMLLLLAIAVIVASSLGTASAQQRSNCETSCGNVNITFPFGSGEGCYYSSDFLVTCNRSSGVPVPYYGRITNYIVISNMSTISKSEVEIMMFVSRGCYNSSGQLVQGNVVSIRWPNFRISTKNKFIAIGCDTIAYFTEMEGNELSDGTGCVSKCGRGSQLTNGSCSGVGCCEVAVPEGMKSVRISISSFTNHIYITDFNPCSYAFFVVPGKYNFSATDLRDFESVEQMPMLLDWAIGNITCDIASKDADFLCKGNSECDPTYAGPGYRCRCHHGYEGNPYANDCMNINECERGIHDCEHTCEDLEGSYMCSCRKGYSGDGRIEGRGCTADQFTVIKIVVSVSISIGVLLLVATIYALYQFIKKTKERRQRERFFKRNGGLLLKQQQEADSALVDKTILFTSHELEKATDNFNENRILGQGGQGTVYKGMLVDGRIVAVKKSKIIDESQLEQFINEVVVLSQVNHRNVVKLLGCCLETEVPLLVSEFISNGTLYDRIHNENNEFPISLNMRLQIATEVAAALAYLHSATSIPIYHRDIKTTNILLGDKYRAKIADFGTSRFVSVDQTHLTTVVKGTFGYLDPEYFQSSQFTEKSDVYSFGVVLVELLTGEKPISLTQFGDNRSLATHFMSAMEEERVMSILDIIVIREGSRDELLALANLAMRCLNLNGKYRPTMKEVAMELETIRMSHLPSIVQTSMRPLMYEEER